MKLDLKQLVIRYAGFACIAVLANLGAQRMVISVAGGGYVAALAVGTLVGLGVKYALDKRWIFYDARAGLQDETRKFTLYTLTGVATTAIFWSSETVFWLVGQTHTMREIGAVLGLTAGYVIKYNLDSRFVFRPLRDNSRTGSDRQNQ